MVGGGRVEDVQKDGAGLDLAVSDRKPKVMWTRRREESISFSYKGPGIGIMG